MAFQTRDEAQDKVSRKVDRVLNKKKREVPLHEMSWDDLNRAGANLAMQEEWLRFVNFSTSATTTLLLLIPSALSVVLSNTNAIHSLVLTI